jgi:hypothetical protein
MRYIQRIRIRTALRKMTMPAAFSVLMCTAGTLPAQDVKLAELPPEVEGAIDRGLAALLKSQHPDGSWGNHKVASTALSLMAFMVKGQFPERPPNGQSLSRAVDFLVQAAKNKDGYMGASMYEHGLATLALSEVSGMVNRADVHDTLKLAVGVILKAQNPKGGWRYSPQPTDADLSASVMQIVALASAKEAGIMVPDETIRMAVEYVKFCHHKPSGGFGYQGPDGPGFERSAAGVMSLMMCGERDSEIVEKGIAYLVAQPEGVFNNSPHYYYGHYYAIQAIYQAGEDHYQAWYPKIRDALLKKQAADGNWADSHQIGTQMAVLILGVPYRFLPIYQR